MLANRSAGGIGKRDDRHDMENDSYLDSRTNRLQSRQVSTGNGVIMRNDEVSIRGYDVRTRAANSG